MDRPEPDALPIVPDVDEDRLHRAGSSTLAPFETGRRRAAPRLHPATLAVIAVGGFVGGLARYGVGRALPAYGDPFPWATFLVNVSGAFGLTLLLVLVVEVWGPTRHVRPAIGTGFFGAYTTWSTYAVEADRLLAHGRVATALLYLGGTAVAGLAAASFGFVVGTAIAGGARRSASGRS